MGLESQSKRLWDPGVQLRWGMWEAKPHPNFFLNQMDKEMFDKKKFKIGHIYMKDDECAESNEK